MTFSVYVIHVHPLCWTLLKSRFTFVAGFREALYVPLVLAFALAIYLVCSLADYLRVLLFRLLCMERFCAAAETFFRKTFMKLYSGITAGPRSR